MPTTEMTMLRPAEELGPALAGRPQAAQIREQIEETVRAGGHVRVDFEGALLSPSFVDELFAKLPADIRESDRLEFVGLSDDTLAFVRFAVDARS